MAFLAALATVLVATCLPAGIARADSPVTVTTNLTDTASFLSENSVQSINRELRALQRKGLDTYIVVVPDFSGTAPLEWCNTVGTQSGLSSSSLVLVIATQERQTATCGNSNQKGIDDATVVSAFSGLREVLSKADPLDESTLATGLNLFVTELEVGLTTKSITASPTATKSAATTSHSSKRNSNSLAIAIGALAPFLLLPVIILVFLFIIMRSQRKTHKNVVRNQAQEHVQQTLDLARLLLDADDIVRSSDDEIQFARAQFGPESVKSYSAALETARALVNKGFTMQRENEDGSHPRSPYEFQEFVGKLNVAMNQLVAEKNAFTQRRNQVANVGQQARELLEMIAQTRTQVDQAEKDLQTLQLAYSPEAVASLKERPNQARALLDQAESSANEALANESNGQNALQILEVARRALALARHQLEAITQAPDQLSRSSELLTAAIGSITSDISDVTRLHADPIAFQQLVASAQEAINAGNAAQNGKGDPLVALESLRVAEAALDEALAPLRSAEERSQRAESGIDALLAQADSDVARASQHVTSHGTLVGFDARSNLSFAQSSLQSAHSYHDQGNDETAAGQARNAITYAQAAINAPLNTPQRSTTGDSIVNGIGLGSMLVWSVLNGMLNGGSSRRHDWGGGGSSWGGSSGGNFGGGGSSGGNFSGGGFGGGGFGGSNGSGHTGSF